MSMLLAFAPILVFGAAGCARDERCLPSPSMTESKDLEQGASSISEPPGAPFATARYTTDEEGNLLGEACFGFTAAAIRGAVKSVADGPLVPYLIESALSFFSRGEIEVCDRHVQAGYRIAETKTRTSNNAATETQIVVSHLGTAALDLKFTTSHDDSCAVEPACLVVPSEYLQLSVAYFLPFAAQGPARALITSAFPTGVFACPPASSGRAVFRTTRVEGGMSTTSLILRDRVTECIPGGMSLFTASDGDGEDVVGDESKLSVEPSTRVGDVALGERHSGGPLATGERTLGAHAWALGRSTIVTAYFDIPSKHSSDEYAAWIANMLSLQDAMVIYTTADKVPEFEQLRAHAGGRTQIVSMEMKEMRMARHYDATFWEAQHALDSRRGIHKDPRLYWIYQEKVELLKRTIESNPFQSEFLAWVDIGYFRTTRYNGKRMLGPPPEQVLKDQVLMLDIRGLDLPKALGGGFIGGYEEGIKLWHTKYYAMLEAHKHEFVGEDQTWMLKTCEKSPGLCVLVVPDRTQGDPWFFMAPFMMGLTKRSPDRVRTMW